MKYVLLIILCISSSTLCYSEIDLKPIHSPQDIIKFKFFSHEFNKHNGSLKSFLNSLKGSKFLSNHLEEIKKIYRTYLKSRKSTKDSGNAETPLNIIPFKYSQYYSDIEIGTPPQNFRVIVDSGSGDLWVPAYDCTHCNGKNKYYSNESSTYVSDNGISFNYCYGLGCASGLLARDDVTFAGLKADDLVLGAANNSLDLYRYYAEGYDGILGMGLKELARSNQTTLIYKLKENGEIEHTIMSIHLATSYENPKAIGSKVIIGGVNPEYYTGNFTYHKILSIEVNGFYGFWVFEGVTIDFGGENNSLTSKFTAVDSGNLDAINYPEIYNPTLPNVNSNCEGIENLPAITITVDDVTYTLEYQYYVYKYSDSVNGDTCSLLIETNQGAWLGAGFIQKYYVKFDYDERIIGFALNKI